MLGFRCGDHVVYGSHGVCTVAAIESRRIDRRPVEYYVLEPLDGSGSRYYVPTQNQAAVSKLRAVLTKEEIDQLLQSDEVRKDAWIEDENLRRQRYKELIIIGDRASLLSMVHCLYQHREQQMAAGRKFHLCDENFLRDAQKLLGSELSLVLQIPENEVGEYVKSAFV